MARPAKLSRERIVDTALELVDRDGMQGLTMRALARELGVDPMALYRHVRDKDALLGAMCDHLLAGLPALDAAEPWEPQVRTLAERLREQLAARPALLPTLTSAPLTPASLLVAVDAIELLTRAGFEPAEAATAFGAVFSYVLGFAVVEAAPPPPADREALRQAAAEHLGEDREAELDAAIELMDGPGDFALGLDLLLDGLRRRLA